MKTAEDYIFEKSHRELASGILQQAAQDLRRFQAATTAIERELYRDAYSWLMVDDFSWPFSFLNVCQRLNLIPEVVRRELLGELSLGGFGYWSRRCGRATRRLQTFLGDAFTNGRNTNTPDQSRQQNASN